MFAPKDILGYYKISIRILIIVNIRSLLRHMISIPNARYNAMWEEVPKLLNL